MSKVYDVCLYSIKVPCAKVKEALENQGEEIVVEEDYSMITYNQGKLVVCAKIGGEDGEDDWLCEEANYLIEKCGGR